jgi:hypothetical protein
LKITVKSAEKGKIKLQIRRKTGFEYKDIEIEKLHGYVMAMEFLADSNQEDFIFLMDDNMKKNVAERLKEMEQLHTK